MIPWELLDSVQVPGNSGELRLYKRGREFSIRVNGCELMNSSAHGSEDALAELACAKAAGRPNPKVLIGGLGMGYTLAAALNRLGPKARVVVAELASAVIEWNRNHLAGLAGHPLQDTRVTIREADVARVLKEKRCDYDVILLDIDNGPEGLTRKSNDWLYSREGLEAALAALRPEGVLAVWSVSSDRSFTRRLKQAGFEVKEVSAYARGSRGGGRHTIWIAVRGS
jgi:spermidine synthase